VLNLDRKISPSPASFLRLAQISSTPDMNRMLPAGSSGRNWGSALVLVGRSDPFAAQVALLSQRLLACDSLASFSIGSPLLDPNSPVVWITWSASIFGICCPIE